MVRSDWIKNPWPPLAKINETGKTQEAPMGKTALIVMDMLNDFLDPGGSLYVGAQAREIIPFVAQKIAEFRAPGRVVIFVCDAHAADDPEFGVFPAHAVKGSWGAGIIPELTPAPGDYRVEKTRYSAFDYTNLDDLLHRSRWRKCTWWG